MIPYSGPPSLTVFGLTFHAFGFLVASGVISGYHYILARAAKIGYPEPEVKKAMATVLLFGFPISHVFEIVFYHQDRLSAEGPLLLLKVWDGISSYGGFLGAVIGFLWFITTIPRERVWVVGDLLIQGLLIGWLFGRLGCTLVMDHPGEITDFFLGFQMPGGARHNLGFYEFLFTLFVLMPAAWLTVKKQARPGMLVALTSALYAPVRFALDSMRASGGIHDETRYGGLTPAQYVSVVLFVYSLYLVKTLKPGNAARVASLKNAGERS